MTSELTTTEKNTPLVVRSAVPPAKSYTEYRPWLRFDFFFCCAYCSMSEAEAQAIRFTIDHYEPKAANPTLANDYANLMYCCDECNTRKGDRCPPPAARAEGYRFYRADTDCWPEHFERKGIRLEHLSNVGEFTIEAIDLNRMTLRTLRGFRERLDQCFSQVSEGILALKRFPIDRLPRQIRALALQQIKRAEHLNQGQMDAIEHVLREAARSPLLEQESGAEFEQRMAERQAKLKEMEALYPGAWRARRKK